MTLRGTESTELSPPIRPRSDGRMLPKYSRQTYGAMLIVCTGVLAVARWLTPSANGVGTHEQLGLPPCQFLQWTGIPCPNCGLTTSFAHAAHFHFVESFFTQPFGLLAFFLTIAAVPTSLYYLRTGKTWHAGLSRRTAKRLMYLLFALYLLGWGYKIVTMRLGFIGS